VIAANAARIRLFMEILLLLSGRMSGQSEEKMRKAA
jgi:hypothetical protein